METGLYINRLSREIVNLWRHDDPFKRNCPLKCDCCGELRSEGSMIATSLSPDCENLTCHTYFVCDECTPNETQTGRMLALDGFEAIEGDMPSMWLKDVKAHLGSDR